MSRILIGCTEQDRALAGRLAEHFGEEARVLAGEELRDTDGALGGCRAYILLFSDEANRSDALLESLQKAIAAGVVVLPLMLSEAAPSSAYTYYIGSIHWLDATRGRQEEAVDLLLERCRALLEEPRGLPDGRRRLRRILAAAAAVVLLASAAAVWLRVRGGSAKPAAVGDRMTFGSYDPDGEGGAKPEPLEWIVADIDEETGAWTLLSARCVEALPYNETRVPVTWERCSLRAYLNGAFLDAAFTEEERQRILETELDNGTLANSFASPDGLGYNSFYKTDNGNDTVDRVFLLSNCELEKYFPNAEDRIAASLTGSEPVTWWVRAAGKGQDTAITVLPDGTRGYAEADREGIEVRPAVRIGMGG
ncbi:MAG: hypothetical protein IJH78_04100 [Clostridia bacterium]|nr:hypothetical protein [Clostridia bacterium]